MSPHGLSMHCHASWVYTKTPSPYGVCLKGSSIVLASVCTGCVQTVHMHTPEG